LLQCDRCGWRVGIKYDWNTAVSHFRMLSCDAIRKARDSHSWDFGDLRVGNTFMNSVLDGHCIIDTTHHYHLYCEKCGLRTYEDLFFNKEGVNMLSIKEGMMNHSCSIGRMRKALG